MKISLRYVLVVLTAFLVLSLVPIRAQESQKKPEPTAPSSQQKDTRSHNPNAAVGRELAKASKTAEGEPEEKEDQTAGLKHSTAVQWIAKKTGISVEMAYWIAMFINFAIVFVAIAALMKSQLPNYFRTRNEAIQRGIQEARAASEDAQRRLKDIEVRLSKLDTEVSQIRASSETESAAEEARIRAAAEADAKRILESAEQEIDAASRQARRDLKSLAAGLAVDLATRKLQIDQATDESLIHNFVAQLGKDGK
jgi:F-type H+-transporting ATPase subunit b